MKVDYILTLIINVKLWHLGILFQKLSSKMNNMFKKKCGSQRVISCYFHLTNDKKFVISFYFWSAIFGRKSFIHIPVPKYYFSGRVDVFLHFTWSFLLCFLQNYYINCVIFSYYKTFKYKILTHTWKSSNQNRIRDVIGMSTSTPVSLGTPMYQLNIFIHAIKICI